MVRNSERKYPRLSVESLEHRYALSADVTLLDVSTPDFMHLDARYSISGADAPPFLLRAYLSADGALDPADILLPGQQAITDPADRVAGTDSHLATLTLTARAPVSESRRFVLVVADWGNAVEAAGNSSLADNVLFAVPALAVGLTMDRHGNIIPFEAVTSESGPFTGAILPGTADHAKLASVDLATVWTPSPQFQFGYTVGETEQWQRDEDHHAQATVLAPLATLATLLQADLARVPAQWGGAVFSINEAYDSLGQHAVAESTHYEGRALDLGVFDGPSGGQKIARLAGLSWLAGFDFVFNEDDHVHVSEHAAFATTIDQESLQQAVNGAFQLGRIDSASVTTSLIHTLDGIDEALQQGRVYDALARLFTFRVEVQNAASDAIRDTGFSQLLLLNVDQLIGRVQSNLPGLPPQQRPHIARGSGHFINANDFVATGVATHLGRYDEVGRIKLSPTDTPGVFRLDGWAIYTAANGDLLFEVFSGRLDVLTGTVTATVTYFGGTGRFAGTAGTGSLSAQLLPNGSIGYAIEGTIDF